jgi:hypothetical protein
VNKPIEERIRWYDRAIRKLGGIPWQARGEGPEIQLYYHMDTYADLGGPERKIKDYWKPPLETPNPSRIEEGRHETELRRWIEHLAEHRIQVISCHHMSAAKILDEIAAALDEEGEPPPEVGFLCLLTCEGCPECEEELLADMEPKRDDPIGRTTA